MTNEFIISIVLALGEFESGNNDAAIGKAGERGRYQITEAKWIETCNRHGFASLGFSWATDPERSHYVCTHIVEDIIEINHAYGAREIYAEYNGGHHGRNRKVVKARAKRFEKLWKEKYEPRRQTIWMEKHNPKRKTFKGARQKRQ